MSRTGNARKERRCCGCGYTRPCSTFRLRLGGYTWFCDECNPDKNKEREQKFPLQSNSKIEKV